MNDNLDKDNAYRPFIYTDSYKLLFVEYMKRSMKILEIMEAQMQDGSKER